MFLVRIEHTSRCSSSGEYYRIPFHPDFYHLRAITPRDKSSEPPVEQTVLRAFSLPAGAPLVFIGDMAAATIAYDEACVTTVELPEPIAGNAVLLL